MSSSRPRDRRVVSILMYCRKWDERNVPSTRREIDQNKKLSTYIVAFAMGHEVHGVAGVLCQASRDATLVPIHQVLAESPAGSTRSTGVLAAVDRIRPGRVGEVRIGGEHLFLLGVADVVVQGHGLRLGLGGERLVVVDELEHVLLVREVAAGPGHCADAVADPFERLRRELEFVHPIDGELEARDPHPGGWVGVAGRARCDSGKLSVDENKRARVRHGDIPMNVQNKRILGSFDI